MSSITELIQLSRFAGERFDLTQANCGNASFKTDEGTMWIKVAGTALSDVRAIEDFCEISLDGPLSFIAANLTLSADRSTDDIDRAAVDCLIAANRSRRNLPSHDTFLHSLLGPFTLHTHPPVVTSIVCQRGWREKIAGLIPDALFVDYNTPGPRIAIAMAEVLREQGWKPGDRAIVFLQNHGLLVSAESVVEVARITDEVVAKLSYFLGVEWSRYRLSNRVSELILSTTGELVCSYLSEDRVLQDAVRKNPSSLLAQPVFPEQVINAGPAGLELTSMDDDRPLVNYIERYGQLPRVIVYRASMNQLFIVAETMSRCREIEQVLKAHTMTLLSAQMPNVQFLPDDELIYLMNWEAEKYKQTV